MKRITFIWNGKANPFHWAQHACIIINDLITDDAYMVSYSPNSIKKIGDPLYHIVPESDRMEETNDRAIVTLYCDDSKKTLTEFKLLYE